MRTAGSVAQLSKPTVRRPAAARHRGGFVYFTSLYVDYAPGGLKKGNVGVRMGREYYTLGGLGGAKDYILADVVDQVRVTVKTGDMGRLEIIPITVVGSSSANDGANFVSYIGQNTTQTFGFRARAQHTRPSACRCR